MESVDPLDKWLDPPDEPERGECEACHEMFDNGDLNKVGKFWPYAYYCDDCLAIFSEEDDE